MTSPRLRTFGLLSVLGLTMAAAGWLRQWPVSLSAPDAGAYRIELSEAVYRTAVNPDLRDVTVVDADDQPVPAGLFVPDYLPTNRNAPRVDVPWFVLPGAAQLPNSELRVISERATDGRVLRVEARETSNASAATSKSWLVDTSALREPIVALQLKLPADTQVEARLRIEGSDDLNEWRVLVADAGILQLNREGASLSQSRVSLPETARYMRITQTQGDAALPLTAIAAETGVAPPQVALQWRDYQPSNIAGDRRSFEFDVDGLQPFEQVDILLPGNSAVSWSLESRDNSNTHWQLRAGPWAQYRIGNAESSRPRTMAPLRQRQWRLVSNVAVAETPTLRLWWQPEMLMFVASGKPPYRVVAGSARHQRQDAPLDDLLAGIRASHGADWQPAIALISGDGEASDPAALSAPRDWKNLALWGVLLLAALLVGGFAVSLLRAKTPRTDKDEGASSSGG